MDSSNKKEKVFEPKTKNEDALCYNHKSLKRYFQETPVTVCQASPCIYSNPRYSFTRNHDELLFFSVLRYLNTKPERLHFMKNFENFTRHPRKRLKPDKSLKKLKIVKTEQLLENNLPIAKNKTSFSLCHSDTEYRSSVTTSDNAPILKNYLLMSDFDYCREVLKEKV